MSPPLAAARALVLALLLGTAPARADLPASPLLPPEHWASEAVSRLDALGLLGDWLPAQKSVHVEAAREAFARAERIARDARPGALALVRGWRERFEREWPGARALLGARVGAGVEGGRAREATSQPARATRDALRLVAPDVTPFLDGTVAIRAAPWIAAGATARLDDRGGELDEGEVALAASWLALHAGRARPGFGFSPGTGVLLSGRATLDRVELLTTRPVRLPWIFGRLGTWTADTFVARLGGSRWPDHTLFWATALRWRIHPRFTLGAQRGILLGGDPWRGFPAWHRALVLVGLDNYRENNMLAVSARWRLPTDELVPLVVDVDWGTDDDPLAAVKVPGVVAGVSAPMVGSTPASVGAEVAWFGRACCRAYDAPWYTHSQYVAGWTAGPGPLGDPIGGNGRALRLRGGWDAGGALRLGSLLWAQDRFSTNLYAPQAGGRSFGASVEAEIRAGRWSLLGRGAHERGTAGWWMTAGAVRASVAF